MPDYDGVIAHQHTIQSPPVDFSKPLDFSNLAGKTALITGGASGIGEALAFSLAGHGANVIIGDINASRGTAVVSRLSASSRNDNHHFVRLDVTDWQSQVECFQEAVRLSPHGGLDIIVAGAGVNIPEENAAFEVDIPDYPTQKNPPAPKLRILKVDLEGVLYTTTLALSYLSQNPGSEACKVTHADASPRPRGRHLILISSLIALTGYPMNSVYVAAKQGIVGMFRSLRMTAPVAHGVRVNMILPYYVETPMLTAIAHVSLLGVPITKVERVTDTLTRLCVDDEIIGRAVLIGPDASKEQIEASGVREIAGAGAHADGAIVDVFGHDFEQADLIMRRVMGLMNVLTAARGWAGFASDVAMRLRNLLPI